MSLSTLAALLVSYLCPASGGSGLAEVRAYLNGLRMDAALSWRAFVAKVFGNVLALASGLVVGKEGPLLHIGSILASPAFRGCCRPCPEQFGLELGDRNSGVEGRKSRCGARKSGCRARWGL